MTDIRHLKLFVKADEGVIDALLSRADGGSKLERGVRELSAESFPGNQVAVASESSSGFAALRADLEDGTATLLDAAPDIIVLSVVDDVRSLASRGANTEEAVQHVRADLVAIAHLIKDTIGAHVLVANASTIDPTDATHNYSGTLEDPIPLRVHRLDHMLIGVSHDEGISILDVDRLIAEMGAADNVREPLAYSQKACAAVAAETVRVLEDYGFFDERKLVAQVGAKGGSR